MPDIDIIIVGAGMAGLAAHATLHSNRALYQGGNLNIHHFEASGRIGGRAYSEQIAQNAIIDWGCEALECANNNPVWNPLANAPHNNPVQGHDPHSQSANVANLTNQSFRTQANFVDPLPNLNPQAVQQGTAIDMNRPYVPANGAALLPVHYTPVVPYNNPNTNHDRFFANNDLAFGPRRVGAMLSYPPMSDGFIENEGSVQNYLNAGPGPHPAWVVDQTLGTRTIEWFAGVRGVQVNQLNQVITLNTPVRQLAAQQANQVVATRTDSQTQNGDYGIATAPAWRVARQAQAAGPYDLILPQLTANELNNFQQCPTGYYFKAVLHGVNTINGNNPANLPVNDDQMTCFKYGIGVTFFTINNGTSLSMHVANLPGRVFAENPQYAKGFMLWVLRHMNPNSNAANWNLSFNYMDWLGSPYIGGHYSSVNAGHAAARANIAALNLNGIYYAGEAASVDYYGQLAGAYGTGFTAARNILVDLGINQGQVQHP